VGAVAEATLDEVLVLWEGLGYYRRARHLHRAARVIRERHGGALPDSYGALRALPGVGAYTAGAVASIAFGEVVPAVDGNARRVLSRLFDLAEPRPAALRKLAERLVDPHRPGAWNQAVMELGATVCVPRRPRCGTCPVRQWCQALRRGTVAERPPRSRPARVRVADFVAAVFLWRDRVLLVRRPEGGLLGGMWSFPVAEVPAGSLVLEVVRAPGAAAGSARTGADTGAVVALEPIRHRFTHLDATYHPVLVHLDGAGRGGGATGGRNALAGGAEGGRKAAEVAGDGPQPTRRIWVLPHRRPPVALPVAQCTILRNVAALVDHDTR